MATGTVTTTRKNSPVRVGQVATGTATSLQGDAAPAANVRVAASEAYRLPTTGTFGLLSFGLVAVTSATGTAPAADSCWAAIEVGFYASDGVTLRWAVMAATRSIAGNLAADNAVMTQAVYHPHLSGAGGGQVTSDHILGASQVPAPTFTGVTGVDNGILAPMTCDAVRVAFYITHTAAASGNWNLQWRLYAYDA